MGHQPPTDSVRVGMTALIFVGRVSKSELEQIADRDAKPFFPIGDGKKAGNVVP
jgi:hypothetical protein